MKRDLAKTIWGTCKVFIFFTSCTLLFYSGFLWIQHEYEKQHRYTEPEGEAMKVISPLEENTDRWLERLLLFYLDGE
ncbi:YqzK family protein [Bacillus sp. B190/17]|uniref:YqzK family protein n=1 Tax=Bacillus lumedeiriae TaxID=3058829 RepID=A0ABW8I4X5_9BACI